jgi:hypothetical protein
MTTEILPVVGTKLILTENASVKPGETFKIPFSKVDYDTVGGYRNIPGRIYVPDNVDLIQVMCNAQIQANDSGTARIIQLYRNGNFLDQKSVRPNGNIYTSCPAWIGTFQATKGDYFEMAAYHDATVPLNLIAYGVDFSVIMMARKPLTSLVREWAKTLQVQASEWLKACGGSYPEVVKRAAGYGILILSGLAGWGPSTPFPHPKPFVGTYTPACIMFDIPGKTAENFIDDVRAINKDCLIFPYTTPLLDYTSAQWDTSTGVPPESNTWNPGNWENMEASLDAINIQCKGKHSGVYLDMIGYNMLTPGKRDELVYRCKRRGLNVMLNFMFASGLSADFALDCPHIGYGDYLLLEGWIHDGQNGFVREGSKAVAAMVKKNAARGVGMVCVTEEVDVPASLMHTGEYQEHFVEGRNEFSIWKEPGWAFEHQNRYYNYFPDPAVAYGTT